MALLQNAEEAAELKKKRAFRKFSYRGIDLEAYVALTTYLPLVYSIETGRLPPPSSFIWSKFHG